MISIPKCFAVCILVSVGGCVSSTPRQIDNVCSVFEQKRKWYSQAEKAAKKWNSDVAILMAFLHKESGFNAKARPPRGRFLWIFPGARVSDAYGYAQAKNSTWDWYEREEGGWFASRDNFADAVDFVGWYNHQSAKQCKISTKDTYRLYLAYHEGQGGYNRGTYENKEHVKRYARVVSKRADQYRSQIRACRQKLKKRGWFIF